MSPIPPGRAGRMWLRHRIDTATRARATLEMKLNRLQDEHERLDRDVRQLTAQWRGEVECAEEWLLRALLQGGRHGVDLASPGLQGEVVVGWTSTMGVRHPGEAEYRPPAAESAQVDTGTAVGHARSAYRTAALTGVRLAAASDAARAVAAEVAATRRRLRALDRRALPRLSASLARLELDLEERDHAEHAARRVVLGRSIHRR